MHAANIFYFSIYTILHQFSTLNSCIFSLPFPVEEDDEEGGGDGDRRSPGHPGMGKGLSGEQKNGLDMVKHIMLSLDEEEGLDQIYSFRWESWILLSHITYVFSSLNHRVLSTF